MAGWIEWFSGCPTRLDLRAAPQRFQGQVQGKFCHSAFKESTRQRRDRKGRGPPPRQETWVNVAEVEMSRFTIPRQLSGQFMQLFSPLKTRKGIDSRHLIIDPPLVGGGGRLFPVKSVGGGGSHIVVGTITAVPSSACSTNNGLFGLPKVSVKNVELKAAAREQASSCTGLSKKPSARLREFTTVLGVSSCNLADVFLDNPV